MTRETLVPAHGQVEWRWACRRAHATARRFQDLSAARGVVRNISVTARKPGVFLAHASVGSCLAHHYRPSLSRRLRRRRAWPKTLGMGATRRAWLSPTPKTVAGEIARSSYRV